MGRRDVPFEKLDPDYAERVYARLMDRVEWNGDCLEYRHRINGSGYGRVSVHAVERTAHKFVFQMLNGPVPPGMEVDHQCHNRLCVRRDHLKLATRSENAKNRRITGLQIDARDEYNKQVWDDSQKEEPA